MIWSEVMRQLKHSFRPIASILYRPATTLPGMDYKSRLEVALKLAKADRKAFAAGIGISVQAVGQVLTGSTSALTAQNSAKAARWLKVDAHWLATGEGEPRPLLMAEREALSTEAVEHATAFDKLKVGEKRLWRTLVMAAKSAATDETVEQHLPALPPGEAEAAYNKAVERSTGRKVSKRKSA